MTATIGSKIEQRRGIGRRALRVSGLGLGTAPLGGLYRDLSDEEAHATIAAAWDAGVRFFDTAPHYGHTKAEHRLGDALRGYPRSEYVLSTKVGRRFVPRTTPYDGSEGWQDPLPFQAIYDYTHDGILRSFEDSQQRLGIVDIDILLVHDIGVVTHGDKNSHYWRQLTEGGGFRALDDLRASGAVKAVGLGVNEGAAILDAMAEFDIDCALLAGRYTLLEQATLDDLLPECEKRGVSILLGGAFNSGILARGVSGDLKFNYGDAPSEIIERVARLETVCRVHGVVRSAGGDRYSLSLKLYALAHRHPPMNRLISEALPLMQRFADAAEQSCHLAVYDRGNLLVIAQVDGPGTWGMSVRLGSRVGLIDTGSGRVMLAFQSIEQRAQMLAEHTKVKGEVTIDRDALEQACERIRAAGFSQKDSQQTFGVTDVTFPVQGPSGQAIAALTCPYLRRIDEYVAPTLEAATALLRETVQALSMFREEAL